MGEGTKASAEGGHPGTKGMRSLLPSCLRAFVPSCLALLLVSCGPRNFENENDRLRAENMELQEQVQKLQQQVEGLQLALKETEAGPQPLPEGFHAPQAVKLELHRWSTAIDMDRDRKADGVRIYAIPTDYQGRAVQVVGEGTLTLLALPKGGEPVQVQTTQIPPEQLNEAFRTGGLTGPHYTLEIPLQQPLPPETTRMMARLTVRDSLTGRTLDAEHIFDWKL